MTKPRSAEGSTPEQTATRQERPTSPDVGRLLAGIVHEVRNPLFSISATADALETRITGDDPVTKQHLTNLRHEIVRLNALLLDLAEYGRPPALLLHTGSLEDVVSQAVHRVEKQAAEKGVQVVNDIQPGSRRVLMDRDRLTTAFEKLLQNAVAHSPAGETVLLSVAESDEAAGAWVSIEIHDRGSYIRPEELSRLFEPFFLRRLGGTGLSLPRVKQLIELHGGEIAARARSEGGITVTIALPTHTGD